MSKQELNKYFGLTAQLIATLGVAFFVGYHIDHFFNWRFPVMLILLPLLFLIFTLWKIVKDTSNKKDE